MDPEIISTSLQEITPEKIMEVATACGALLTVGGAGLLALNAKWKGKTSESGGSGGSTDPRATRTGRSSGWID